MKIEYFRERLALRAIAKQLHQKHNKAGKVCFKPYLNTLLLRSLPKRLHLPYIIPKTALVKPPENDSGYSPDILVVNRSNLGNEPLWKKQSTVIHGASIPLVIEVVSTNWRDDYFTKLGQYEAIGIPEYWIVDYAALGGKRFLGNPKQPTISIYSLVEGEYRVNQFRGDNMIVSPIFPELSLTANQIFQTSS